MIVNWPASCHTVALYQVRNVAIVACEIVTPLANRGSNVHSKMVKTYRDDIFVL